MPGGVGGAHREMSPYPDLHGLRVPGQNRHRRTDGLSLRAMLSRLAPRRVPRYPLEIQKSHNLRPSGDTATAEPFPPGSGDPTMVLVAVSITDTVLAVPFTTY